MALSVSQTLALKNILKPGMKVASMGYPDLIAPIEDIPGLEYRADSDVICARHGLRPRRIPDAESYFSLMGCELHVYDIVKERGCERLCDLNEPLLVEKQYDIVLDVGTVEHVINIWQALVNIASLVKLGGHVLHENPFNWGNHGFYNLNPTFYADFYGQNGFEMIECKLVDRNGNAAVVPPASRFRWEGKEMNMFAMARRIKIQEFVYPTQSKYKKLFADAGLAGEEEKEIAHG